MNIDFNGILESASKKYNKLLKQFIPIKEGTDRDLKEICSLFYFVQAFLEKHTDYYVYFELPYDDANGSNIEYDCFLFSNKPKEPAILIEAKIFGNLNSMHIKKIYDDFQRLNEFKLSNIETFFQNNKHPVNIIKLLFIHCYNDNFNHIWLNSNSSSEIDTSKIHWKDLKNSSDKLDEVLRNTERNSKCVWNFGVNHPWREEYPLYFLLGVLK